MAYRRRYKKRSYKRPTRSFRRKYRRGYKNLSGNNKVYYFTRLSKKATIVGNGSTEVYGGDSFKLSQVANYQEYTALYDMYKINAVKITILPEVTQSTSLTTTNASASARFFSVIDRNDASTPTSIDELREYKSCKFTSIVRPHKRFIMKPKILDRGGTYTPGNPWIKCDSPDQEYYGFRYAIEENESGEMEFSVEVKYYLAFKNVK